MAKITVEFDVADNKISAILAAVKGDAAVMEANVKTLVGKAKTAKAEAVNPTVPEPALAVQAAPEKPVVQDTSDTTVGPVPDVQNVAAGHTIDDVRNIVLRIPNERRVGILAKTLARFGASRMSEIKPANIDEVYAVFEAEISGGVDLMA